MAPSAEYGRQAEGDDVDQVWPLMPYEPSPPPKKGRPNNPAGRTRWSPDSDRPLRRCSSQARNQAPIRQTYVSWDTAKSDMRRTLAPSTRGVGRGPDNVVTRKTSFAILRPEAFRAEP